MEVYELKFSKSKIFIALALWSSFTFIIAMMTVTVFAQDSIIDWNKGVVKATGMAAGKKGEKRIGLARAQARRAARMDAERNLGEQIQGVQVTGESSLRDLALEYDTVKTQMAAVIKNMREAGEPKYNEDGTCEITLEIPLWGKSSVAGIAFVKDQVKTPFS